MQKLSEIPLAHTCTQHRRLTFTITVPNIGDDELQPYVLRALGFYLGNTLGGNPQRSDLGHFNFPVQKDYGNRKFNFTLDVEHDEWPTMLVDKGRDVGVENDGHRTDPMKRAARGDDDVGYVDLMFENGMYHCVFDVTDSGVVGDNVRQGAEQSLVNITAVDMQKIVQQVVNFWRSNERQWKAEVERWTARACKAETVPVLRYAHLWKPDDGTVLWYFVSVDGVVSDIPFFARPEDLPPTQLKVMWTPLPKTPTLPPEISDED